MYNEQFLNCGDCNTTFAFTVNSTTSRKKATRTNRADALAAAMPAKRRGKAGQAPAIGRESNKAHDRRVIRFAYAALAALLCAAAPAGYSIDQSHYFSSPAAEAVSRATASPRPMHSSFGNATTAAVALYACLQRYDALLTGLQRHDLTSICAPRRTIVTSPMRMPTTPGQCRRRAVRSDRTRG